MGEKTFDVLLEGRYIFNFTINLTVILFFDKCMLKNIKYRIPDVGKVSWLHFEVTSSRGDIKILPKVFNKIEFEPIHTHQFSTKLSKWVIYMIHMQ